MRATLAALVLLWTLPARAEWKPEYAQSSPVVRDWYARAEIMPAARHRFLWTSCCAHADVVKTKFRVGKSAGHGHDGWWWLNGSQWQRIPDDIIHWGEAAPGGEPTLFVYAGSETCFYPPDGGI